MLPWSQCEARYGYALAAVHRLKKVEPDASE
jgi:hypothetical protein